MSIVLKSSDVSLNPTISHSSRFLQQTAKYMNWILTLDLIACIRYYSLALVQVRGPTITSLVSPPRAPSYLKTNNVFKSPLCLLSFLMVLLLHLHLFDTANSAFFSQGFSSWSKYGNVGPYFTSPVLDHFLVVHHAVGYMMVDVKRCVRWQC